MTPASPLRAGSCHSIVAGFEILISVRVVILVQAEIALAIASDRVKIIVEDRSQAPRKAVTRFISSLSFLRRLELLLDFVELMREIVQTLARQGE